MPVKQQSRELALQILFQAEYNSDYNIKDLLETSAQVLSAEDVSYAQEIASKALSSQTEIDSLIEVASQHWKLNRMASVDRNILRVAISEMLKISQPMKPQIVIDEAIELAKRYGSQDSPSFVNGILDQILKAEG